MSDIDQIIRQALSQGWQHDITTCGHHQFYAPNGRDIVTHSGTPSDHRAYSNFLSRMKRSGFIMGSRIKYGEARRQIMGYLQRHAGQEVTRDDLRAYLKSVLPGISEVTIGKNLREAETHPQVTNTRLGIIYREATPAAPEPAPAPSPGISSDPSEEADLDAALEALAKVERIIRKHRAIAQYLSQIMQGREGA